MSWYKVVSRAVNREQMKLFKTAKESELFPTVVTLNYTKVHVCRGSCEHRLHLSATVELVHPIARFREGAVYAL